MRPRRLSADGSGSQHVNANENSNRHHRGGYGEYLVHQVESAAIDDGRGGPGRSGRGCRGGGGWSLGRGGRGRGRRCFGGGWSGGWSGGNRGRDRHGGSRSRARSCGMNSRRRGNFDRGGRCGFWRQIDSDSFFLGLDLARFAWFPRGRRRSGRRWRRRARRNIRSIIGHMCLDQTDGSKITCLIQKNSKEKKEAVPGCGSRLLFMCSVNQIY